MKRKIGIVGYGKLGQFLVDKLLNDEETKTRLELVFVWNRSVERMQSGDAALPKELILQNLDDFEKRGADLIVEVAHPDITKQFGVRFLRAADYFLGSPTAMADADTETSVLAEAKRVSGHGLYVPAGALWGAADIAKMAARGTLRRVRVTMKKHPSSLKVRGALLPKLEEAAKVTDAEVELYAGNVRDLCPMAPNNVNTMACAALAGLGMEKTEACLVSDARLESHDIIIEVEGPVNAQTGAAFSCTTKRINPAAVGAVTGSATYVSFLSSMLIAGSQGDGVHFC